MNNICTHFLMELSKIVRVVFKIRRLCKFNFVIRKGAISIVFEIE